MTIHRWFADNGYSPLRGVAPFCNVNSDGNANFSSPCEADPILAPNTKITTNYSPPPQG